MSLPKAPENAAGVFRAATQTIESTEPKGKVLLETAKANLGLIPNTPTWSTCLEENRCR